MGLQKHATKWVLGMALLAGMPAQAATRRCSPEEYAKIVGAKQAFRGPKKVKRLYAALQNPEAVLKVDLKNLSRDLREVATPTEVRELTAFLHSILEKATRNADGTPNDFATSNLQHVALHYRDIEANRAAIQEFFGGAGEGADLADLALLNAAAHDLGKVAEAAGALSPDVRATYNRAVKELPPNVQFFMKTIMGHDGLTMDAIATLVPQFGRAKGWDGERAQRVTALLQAASARHNAGYGNLANDAPNGIYHFWQSTFPSFAQKMRDAGADVDSEYPAARGGWMPVLLAMVDRGTSLHPSFVEKIATQGNFVFDGKSVGTLLTGNAKSVRDEVKAIAQELEKHSAKPIAEFPIYQKYLREAQAAEALGQKLIRMNDFTAPVAGRPEVPEAERSNFVYYQTPAGQWVRVQKEGLLQAYVKGAWQVETVDAGLNGAQILMRRVIGYPAIDSAAPRTSAPTVGPLVR